MGTMCHIDTNPLVWRWWDSGKRLKPEYGGEELFTVVYGWIDDYPSGTLELEIYMRESVLNKVMSGEYRVSKESYFKKTLILCDNFGNEIEPLGSICY